MDRHDHSQLLVDVAEASRLLGLGRSKIYQLLLARELASLRVGRRRLIPRHCLDEFIAKRLADEMS